MIGDSEADIYELFSEPRDTCHDRPLEILVRGCQERATTERGRSILDHARSTPCRYTAKVDVSPCRAKIKVETRKRASERPARVANIEVRTIVTYYCHRWSIEVYYKTLKSGCRIEERQFEFLDREMNCEHVFEPSEWKAVYLVVTKTDPPKTPPGLNAMIRLIALLGGYVSRTKTVPGTQTLWIRLQRMHDFANC